IEARRAADHAGAATSAAEGGAVRPAEIVAQSQAAARAANAATGTARQAALEATTAAETARVAASAQPAPPAPARVDATYPSEPLVTFTSSPPDSVVGDYRIDMATLDGNGDGRLSRAEARANATLSAEFAAVDNNNDGVLDAGERRGWRRGGQRARRSGVPRRPRDARAPPPRPAASRRDPARARA